MVDEKITMNSWTLLKIKVLLIAWLSRLTTRNSALSTRWLPSVSNMLKAILNPDCGSEINARFTTCAAKLRIASHSLGHSTGTNTPCSWWFPCRAAFWRASVIRAWELGCIPSAARPLAASRSCAWVSGEDLAQQPTPRNLGVCLKIDLIFVKMIRRF